MIRSFRRRLGFGAATRSNRRAKRRRLALELLEDRTVPSPLLVTTTADEINPNDGVLSLREAIMMANADASASMPQSHTITFAASLGRATITLDPTLGQLEMSGANTSGATETIDGGGRITVSGNDLTRVFQVDAGVTAVFSGLTITHGLADKDAPGIHCVGGGFLNFGDLALESVVVSDNRAVGDATANADGRGLGFAAGGGVYNRVPGSLTVSDSTFVHNQALGGSGSSGAPFPGTAAGGAIANTGGPPSRIVSSPAIWQTVAITITPAAPPASPESAAAAPSRTSASSLSPRSTSAAVTSRTTRLSAATTTAPVASRATVSAAPFSASDLASLSWCTSRTARSATTRPGAATAIR
jgi:CSLREA domain-containing protein